MKGMETLRKLAIVVAMCVAVLFCLGCNNNTKAEQEQVFKGGEDTADKFLQKGAYIKIYGKGVHYKLPAQIKSIFIGENGIDIAYNATGFEHYDASEYRIFLNKDCNIIIRPKSQKEILKQKQVKERTELLTGAIEYYNNLELAKLCIKLGANVNAKNNKGETILMRTIDKGNKDIAELLIKSGADVNAKSANGETALIWAASRGYKDIAELLIKSGAYVNARVGGGKTVLMHAISKDVANILIKSGADVNAKDNDGKTALMRIAGNGSMPYFKELRYKDIAELLIKSGADVNAKENNGGTALMEARNHRHDIIADLLRAAGAKE